MHTETAVLSVTCVTYLHEDVSRSNSHIFCIPERRSAQDVAGLRKLRLLHSALDLGQFVDAPVASEGLDQQDTRIELAPADIDIVPFVTESRCLRSYHL